MQKKEQSHTTKDELQGRAFDNQNVLLEFGYPAVLIFYLSVRFVCIGCLTGNALTGIIWGKFVLMWFFIF
jgi:hypothetical protein